MTASVKPEKGEEAAVYVLLLATTEGCSIRGVTSDELKARRWVESYHPSHGSRYEAHKVDDPTLDLNTLGMTRTAALKCLPLP